LFIGAVAVLLIKRSRHPSPDQLFVTRRLIAESVEQSAKFVEENGELSEEPEEAAAETAETKE